MRSVRMGMVPPWRMRFAAICEVFGVVEAGISSTTNDGLDSTLDEH